MYEKRKKDFLEKRYNYKLPNYCNLNQPLGSLLLLASEANGFLASESIIGDCMSVKARCSAALPPGIDSKLLITLFKIIEL